MEADYALFWQQTVFGEETPDQKYLVYIASRALWRQPLGGDKSEKVLEHLDWREFVPAEKGMYFIERTAQPMQQVEYLDYVTQQRRPVATIGPRPNHTGTMAVSPDRKWLLFDRTDQANIEIMLVENFR